MILQGVFIKSRLMEKNYIMSYPNRIMTHSANDCSSIIPLSAMITLWHPKRVTFLRLSTGRFHLNFDLLGEIQQ